MEPRLVTADKEVAANQAKQSDAVGRGTFGGKRAQPSDDYET